MLQRRQNKRNPTYVLNVVVANTDPVMLTRLVEIFETGRIYPRAYSNPRNRPSWAWKVCSKQAERVLRIMLPYLVTKRPQAEVALLSRSLMSRGFMKNEELATLERMAQDITAMKHERKTL